MSMRGDVNKRDIMNPDMSFCIHNATIRDVALYSQVGFIDEI